MKKQFITLLSAFLLFSSGFAQNDLRIGQWREHLTFRSGIYITQSPDEVFYSNGLAVLSINKTDYSTKVYSKINSLSDVGVSVLRYQAPLDILVVAYKNSNIDLLTPSGVVNLPFIKLFDDPGDKTINDIFLDGNAAFFSCGFGIVKLNLEREEFEFTTFTGFLPVLSMTRWQNQYYALTEEGVYAVPVNSNNLADFSNWKRLGANDGFPEDYQASAMAPFNDVLYLGINDSLFRYDGKERSFVFRRDTSKIRYLTAEGEHLIMGLNRPSLKDQVLRFDATDAHQTYNDRCVDTTLYAIEDEQNRLWIADNFSGYRINFNPEDPCAVIELNTPHTTEIYSMTVTPEGDVWVASGSIESNQNYTFSALGFYGRINGEWSIYNPFTVPELLPLRDFLDVEVHPLTGTIYSSSFLDGLVEFSENGFVIYDDSNSGLTNAVGDSERTRVGGIAFDQENNLWMCNHVANRPIAVYTNEGEWQKFDAPTSSTRYLDVMVDQNNYKWFAIASSTSEPLVVLDTGEDLANTDDDRTRVITTTNSELPVGRVTSMATDLDGNVWIGTTEGVVAFECGANVFDASCRGVRRIVEQDGFNAFLLETETVTAIAIDGANRKWFGTQNGVFVQSPDGEEQIAFFDTENSPLIDNVIIDIDIDPRTGEVYIGTASGLVSFMSDATEGGIVNNSKPVVYPNPVEPDYDGLIAIKGLARDANIKITDINGKLVYETTALGGQATWNGRDYTGRKAQSGVYLVFSTNTRNIENPDAVVAKIIFLN